MNEKLLAIHNEVEKWTNIQNILIKNINHLSITIQGSILLLNNTKKSTDTEKMKLSDNNDSEILLGIDILCRQIENKKIKTMNEICEKTSKLGNFLILGKELLNALRKYEDLVCSSVQEDIESVSPRASENIKKSTDNLIAKMKECIFNFIQDYFRININITTSIIYLIQSSYIKFNF